MILLKSGEEWWKMSVVVTSFSNDESARPAMLLKTESTTDILIEQVHKFRNSYFNPLVSVAPFLYPLKTSENFTIVSCFQGVENKAKRLPLFYKKHIVLPITARCCFLYPLKTSENPKVFWCFQGIWKSKRGCNGLRVCYEICSW